MTDSLKPTLIEPALWVEARQAWMPESQWLASDGPCKRGYLAWGEDTFAGGWTEADAIQKWREAVRLLNDDGA